MNRRAILENYLLFPLRILTHPVKAYTEFKEDKKGKMSVAIVFMLLASLTSMLAYLYNGIIINGNNPAMFSSVRIIIYTIVPVVLLSVANWSVTTLMNGKGKMKEIFLMGAYAHFPVIIGQLLVLVFSNVATEDEFEFIRLISMLAYAAMAYMIFMGLIVIHEYSLFKAIVTVIFTIVALAIIIFVGLLLFDLSEQIYGFFSSLYKEIITRFF